MAKSDLDKLTEDILKDDNPTAKAVSALIEVEDREAGKPSTVELKTDLSEDEIKLHTVLGSLSKVLEMSEKDFSEKCILLDVIEMKERKALSKDRQSRGEIVAVARQPDMNMGMGDMGMPHKDNFVKRFFTSRRNKNQNE